jgi:hypothetical protein
MVIFFQRQGVGFGFWLSLSKRFKNIIILDALNSFTFYEKIISSCVFLLFLSMIFFAIRLKIINRNLKYLDCLFVAALCCLAIYFISPDSISRGSFLNPRLALYPFFALILWFGNISYSKIIRRYLVTASIALSLLFIAAHSVSYSKADGIIAKYIKSFDYIKNNSTLLPLSFEPRIYPDSKVLSLFHLGSYITTQKEVVSFDNYQAGKFRYFPVVFKNELNPWKHLSKRGKHESTKPDADLNKYSKRTKKDVEYILCWGEYGKLNYYFNKKLLFKQIAKDYKLIYSAHGKHLLEIYKIIG